MTSSRDQSRDDLLRSLLVAYDEALGADRSPPEPAGTSLGSDLQLEARFREAAECLELLNRVRRSEMKTTVDADTVGFTANPAEETTSKSFPRIIGRYRIERQVGRGGLGVVFLANDPQLHRKVAIKIPRFDAAAGEESRGRFLREAEAAARLRHPNLVALYEV